MKLLMRIKRTVHFKLPFFYYFLVNLISIFLAAIKYKVFFLNGKKAHWYLQTRKGEDYLQNKWKSVYSISDPLILPLEKVNEINFPNWQSLNIDDIHQFNPSIVFVKNAIRIAWRISNVSFNPATFPNGDPKQANANGDFNAIGIGEISSYEMDFNQKISNFRILLDPRNCESQTKYQDEYGRNRDFEDPRFLPDLPNLMLLHTRYTGMIKQKNLPNYDVALYDLDSENITILKLVSGMRSEKNWVPIGFDDQKYRFLRSTKPFSIITFDFDKKTISEISNSEEEFGDEHNGSNFLLIDKKFYLRVIRKSISIQGLRDVRINTFTLHDLDLNEIDRTLPFIFKDFGFEICNSIAEHSNKIYFAWGMDDTSGFLGCIGKSELVKWIRKNLISEVMHEPDFF